MTLENAITIKDINLNIKHGEFVCIIGDVGSGKSSLLNTLIGDLLYLPNEYIEENKDQLISDPTVASLIKHES
jgi:ABC-type lipoprotein export system ATPase subunit